jgi:hypothetical protein
MFRRCFSLVAVAVVGLSNMIGQVEGVKFEMTARAYPETSESVSTMKLFGSALIHRTVFFFDDDISISIKNGMFTLYRYRLDHPVC